MSADGSVVKGPGFLDRYLSVWIFAVGIGRILEVSVLIGLVHVELYLQSNCFPGNNFRDVLMLPMRRLAPDSVFLYKHPYDHEMKGMICQVAPIAQSS